MQLGQVQAAGALKVTSTREIAAKAATIEAYVREAIVAAKAGKKVETKPRREQSAARPARIETAMPAIFAGRGFLERR